VVVVILNNLQFEAERFETRTMPTPDMKGKEIIYWIKVGTQDKRLATELQRFLEGAPKFIDLRVPSAFVAARTELESYRIFPLNEATLQKKVSRRTDLDTGAGRSKENQENESPDADQTRLEIILRRTISQAAGKQTQTPYG
jgi:hypothetical protein